MNKQCVFLLIVAHYYLAAPLLSGNSISVSLVSVFTQCGFSKASLNSLSFPDKVLNCYVNFSVGEHCIRGSLSTINVLECLIEHGQKKDTHFIEATILNQQENGIVSYSWMHPMKMGCMSENPYMTSVGA